MESLFHFRGKHNVIHCFWGRNSDHCSMLIHRNNVYCCDYKEIWLPIKDFAALNRLKDKSWSWFIQGWKSRFWSNW
jgi:hypothetical protein